MCTNKLRSSELADGILMQVYYHPLQNTKIVLVQNYTNLHNSKESHCFNHCKAGYKFYFETFERFLTIENQ